MNTLVDASTKEFQGENEVGQATLASAFEYGLETTSQLEDEIQKE